MSTIRADSSPQTRFSNRLGDQIRLTTKRVALIALFVLGVLELLFPLEVALLIYAHGPGFRRVLTTEEQQQLYVKFYSAVYAKYHTVFYFGLATLIIAVVLLLSDRRKSIVSGAVVGTNK